MGHHWHHESPEVVLGELTSSTEGLSQEEAAARLLTCGPNRLPEPKKRGALLRLVLHFHNILI